MWGKITVGRQRTRTHCGLKLVVIEVGLTEIKAGRDLDLVVCFGNPRVGEAETEGPLGLAAQPG